MASICNCLVLFVLLFSLTPDVLLGVEFAGADSGGCATGRTDALHGLSLRYGPETLRLVCEELSTRLDRYVPPASPL